MSDGSRSTVTVEIAGEQYSIRTEAPPDHTRECAALVDRTISDILGRGVLIEEHKAAILAALSIADELLKARSGAERTRSTFADHAAKLAGEMESALVPDDLASAP